MTGGRTRALNAARQRVGPDVNTDQGIARIPLFRQDGSHVWAVVDLPDFPLVSDLEWCEVRAPRTSYAQAQIGSRRTNDRKVVTMHRLIVRPPAGLMVDHSDGDGLNNRRSNLRVATRSQNRANDVNVPRDRDVKFKGVVWKPRQEFWTASIGINGKNVYLGSYGDPVSAALAYDDALRAHAGEFARTNFTYEESLSIPRTPAKSRVGRKWRRKASEE